MCAIGIPDSSPILSSEPHPLTLTLTLIECLLVSFFEDLGFRNHPRGLERQQATELEHSGLSLLQYLLSSLPWLCLSCLGSYPGRGPSETKGHWLLPFPSVPFPRALEAPGEIFLGAGFRAGEAVL